MNKEITPNIAIGLIFLSVENCTSSGAKAFPEFPTPSIMPEAAP